MSRILGKKKERVATKQSETKRFTAEGAERKKRGKRELKKIEI
jgi:hypothetical protein